VRKALAVKPVWRSPNGQGHGGRGARLLMAGVVVALAVAANPGTASAALHTTVGWQHGILNACCYSIAWSPGYASDCNGASPPWAHYYCTPRSDAWDSWHSGGLGKYSWVGIYHRHDNGGYTQHCYSYDSYGGGSNACDSSQGWGSHPCRKESWTAGEHRGAGITDHVVGWHGMIAAAC
jgi:hypothetical protein